MRTIKFRSWAKTLHVMLPVSDVHIETGLAKCKWDKTWDIDAHLVDDLGYVSLPIGEHGNPLMQFTGLHDKNGKEIYEGDVLKYPNGLYALAMPQHVVWNDGSFQMLPSEIRVNEWAAKGTEVIGNVYETPELLKS